MATAGRSGVVLMVAALTTALSGCASSSHAATPPSTPTTVVTTAPTSSGTPARSANVVKKGELATLVPSGYVKGAKPPCHPTHPTTWGGSASGPLVGFDAHPTGGELIHEPGLSTTECVLTTAKLTAQEADSIAQLVDRATAVPTGMFNCPMDDSSAVAVVLDYPGGKQEFALRALSGCQFWTAPGHRAVRDDGTGGALLRR